MFMFCMFLSLFLLLDCEFTVGCALCSEAVAKIQAEKAKEEKVNAEVEAAAAAQAASKRKTR
jgi:hypothetical protein